MEPFRNSAFIVVVIDAEREREEIRVRFRIFFGWIELHVHGRMVNLMMERDTWQVGTGCRGLGFYPDEQKYGVAGNWSSPRKRYGGAYKER